MPRQVSTPMGKLTVPDDVKCMVRFKCKKCGAQDLRDAYDGPPLCMSSDHYVEFMQPIVLVL